MCFPYGYGNVTPCTCLPLRPDRQPRFVCDRRVLRLKPCVYAMLRYKRYFKAMYVHDVAAEWGGQCTILTASLMLA